MTLKNEVFHAIQNWYISNFGVVYTSSKKNEAFKPMQINDHTFRHFKLYHCTSATQGL